MTTLPPTGAGALAKDCPDVWQAYRALGKSAAEEGLSPEELRQRSGCVPGSKTIDPS